MFSIATLILTIVSALSVGVLFGWAVLSAILFLFSLSRRKEELLTKTQTIQAVITSAR
jgi:hypothetical protein